MRLGLYYHIPAVTNDSGKIGLPAFFGKFVDSLAVHVNHLYCFFHTNNDLSGDAEYWCFENNITLVSLGPDRPAYIKALLPCLFFNKKTCELIENCDAILVRGPSPLAPYFQKFRPKTNVVYFLVGSYKEGSRYLKLPIYKEWAVRLLVLFMHLQTVQSIKGEFLLVNSMQLEIEYGKFAKSVKQVFTTTLTDEDFYYREDTCKGDRIRLLYTGRLDWAKGLNELFNAFVTLQHKYGNFELHFVGWEESIHKPVEKNLIQRAVDNGLKDFIFFHGRKPTGPELFHFYRFCDIYILPSYHEGFPRTIWEAMANSIPIIATEVGAIPYLLKDGEHAFIIKPKSAKAIEEGVIKVLENEALRRNLILNAGIFVQELTLTKQSKLLINLL